MAFVFDFVKRRVPVQTRLLEQQLELDAMVATAVFTDTTAVLVSWFAMIERNVLALRKQRRVLIVFRYASGVCTDEDQYRQYNSGDCSKCPAHGLTLPSLYRSYFAKEACV